MESPVLKGRSESSIAAPKKFINRRARGKSNGQATNTKPRHNPLPGEMQNIGNHNDAAGSQCHLKRRCNQ